MIHITEVTTKAQLRQFVNFPIDLYRDVPQYIPGTYSDDLADWDREKNPAFSYCEARCWLASRDDGTLVGRIGAILSRKSNDKWGTHRLRFTQVDFIDDREVSAALFQTVEDWARQLGCTEVHGPLGFTDMDREGMLVEGFDRTSCFFTYYNHPYYIDHLTALGYGKDVDWTENLISVPTDQRVIQRWEKIAAYVLKRQRLHIDLLLIAVRPDLQKKGVNAVIISKVMHGCFKIGVKQAETGPMLETNEKVQSQWQDFPLEQHKRRRCFVKVLTPAPQESAAAATAPVGAAE